MSGDRPDGTGVVLDDVHFSYGPTAFRFDVSFRPAATTAVMGASGSGKSTLLALIAGFEQPRSGRVLIGGTAMNGLAPAERPVSMVFQENNVFPHLSVEKNVGLGRSPSLRLTEGDRQAVAAALGRVGLAGKEQRLPGQLSGGERQRVALARVLVRDRPVLLLDEPFASLGPALRADMLDLLGDLQAERGLTVLFVTHHPEDARRVAGEVVFLDRGTVAEQGPAGRFFGDDPPPGFRDYIGARQGLDMPGSRHI